MPTLHPPPDEPVGVSGLAVEGTFPRGWRDGGELPGGHTLRDRRTHGQRPRVTTGRSPALVRLQIPPLVSWLWDRGRVTELLSLSFHVPTGYSNTFPQ